MKLSLSSLPLVVAGLLVASFAAAENPHAPAAHAPPAKAAPALKVAPRVQAPAPKTAAKVPAKVVVAKPAATEKKAAEPEHVPVPGVPFIRPETSDPGITIKAEPGTSRVRVTGTAEGPRLVDYMGRETRSEDDASYGVARGVSFDVDKHTMPDFSKDPNYTRKNQWYFAHLATVDTHRGDSAMLVAKRLAASLSKGGAYDAKVSEDAEGALIEITPR